MAEILVTGGTGTLGRELVPRLVAKGYPVRVLSRRDNPSVTASAQLVKGDLVTGEGVEEALAGVETVVHLASGTGTARSLTYRSARVTDAQATARLVEAAKRAGVSHFVYISIVGIDEIPLGYYRGKLEAEQAIEASGVPYTILRTTQWHTFISAFCEAVPPTPVIVVPKGVRMQLLDVGEVAERMVSLIDAGPSGRVDDMGGPDPIGMADAVRAYLQATGSRRRVAALPLPGKAVAGFRAGHNLTPDHAVGRITWEDWLSRV